MLQFDGVEISRLNLPCITTVHTQKDNMLMLHNDELHPSRIPHISKKVALEVNIHQMERMAVSLLYIM
jgi:hypothetical protein